MAANDKPPTIHPVILSGGTGSRLWPLSRAHYPKQLLPLLSERSLLQETVLRVADPQRFAAPLIVCNHEHRFVVAEQLREIGVTPRAILLEPEARNTAPAAATAALLLGAQEPEALLLLLPSDHAVADAVAYQAALDTAAAGAAAGELVTFGMRPDRPETGYGYIRRGTGLTGAPGCFRVARFREKPDPGSAAAMLAEGGWLWNSGMFLFAASSLLAEMERICPAILRACRSALERGRQDLDFFRLEAEAFAGVPAQSLDVAVMERTERAAVVPAEIGWNDIGSWSSLWQLGGKDAGGNVVLGEVLAREVADSYLRAEGRLLAALGVRNLLVVVTDDAVLVADKGRAQDVKRLVEELKARSDGIHLAHRRVYRPWGSYEAIDAGDRFQVKQLVIKPGAKLSLQRHRHRAEHWVVVNGTARVTRGEEVFELSANQSTYIPLGVRHRLENPGAELLRIIEIQSGDYLGEDDIERYDDVYGRAEP